MGDPGENADLQGLTANEPTSELARRQDGTSENATHHPATGETDGSVTDIAGWKASLPPYATDLHYQQLNATQLNELIGKGGLWASKAKQEMRHRNYR